MRNLFGNPEDGTFLAWFADDGLWIALIAFGAIGGWLVVRHYTKKFLNRAVDTLEQYDMDEPVKARFNLVRFLLESAVTGRRWLRTVTGTNHPAGSMSQAVRRPSRWYRRTTGRPLLTRGGL